MRLAIWATGAAFALGALFPGGRTWGLEAAADVPRALLAALLALLAIAPLAGRRLRIPLPRVRSDHAFLAIVLAVAVLLFVGLRARAAFLGDGAQNLALLASAEPMPKTTAPLTWLLLDGARRITGGEPERAARLAYRIVSVGSGIAFLLVAWFLGRSVAPSPRARRLLLLGLATGGWSLQFFGYFENYAPFLVATTAYALAGVRAARTGRGRVLAAVLAAVATSLHVLGALLLPSLAPLLAPARLRPRTRLVAAAIMAAVALAVAARAISRDLARQLLFVPPLPTRFGAPGYTLFSLAHLADLANLLVLLVPGAAVLGVALARGRATARDPARAFLIALAASVAAGAFLLDPKLGLPRDWDLFAFVGPPLALAAMLPLLARAERDPAAARAVALVAAVGAFALLPRAVTNADEAAAFRQFRRHLALDPARGRSARQLGVEYLRRLGADDLARAEVARWDADYPERVLARQAVDAYGRGDTDEAIRLNRLAIERAPSFPDPWNNLGSCHLAAGRLDDARAAFEVARALNPGLPATWMNLGTVCFVAGDLDGAERWWKRAWRRDPDGALANKLLARLAQARGDDAAYERHLGRAAAAAEAPEELVREWREREERRAADARGGP